MKKGKIILIVSGIFVSLIIWYACQKDEEPGTLYKDSEIMQLKSGSAVILSTTGCIDPEAPEYFVVHDQLIVGWAGSDNYKYSKTIEIEYYNTLTNFVLRVKSSNGIADMLMDDVSVKNFEGTVLPDNWQEITFPLGGDWNAGDTWAFTLKVTGSGPPAYFDVEYKLIGECVYYMLGLSVCPEDAGTLTGAGNYRAGEEIPLTATASEGYVFVNWTDEYGDEISPDADFTYTMHAEDHFLTANFIATSFALNIAVEPHYAGTVTGAGNYTAGMIINISAIPAGLNYVLGSWTASTGDFDDPGALNTTFTMPAEDVTVTANFLFEVIYGEGVTDLDGNFYTSVIIGNQEWMAENLRVTHYRNGNPIPANLSDSEWIETEMGAYAVYPDSLVEGINSKEEMVAAYGRLYNWYAVDDSRGLCPAGWHVSTDDEWTTLVNYLGRWTIAGRLLKSTRTAPDDPHPRWGTSSRRATNESGWSGLPGGDRGTYGNFYLLGYDGNWWSSEAGTNTAWSRQMEYRFYDVNRIAVRKTSGFSVRCLRD